jgi:outer membrane protein TolC
MSKVFSISFFLLFFVSLSFAEKINKKIILEQTLVNNPLVSSSQLQLENAKNAYKVAFSAFLPSVDLSAQTEKNYSNNIENSGYSIGGTVSLSIFSGFSDYNNLKSKSAEIDLAQASYQRAVSDAVYEVMNQYVNLMWAFETVELLKKIKGQREENKSMVELKYNSGNVDLGSLKRVEADAAIAEYELRKAERYIETASAALLKSIGRNDIGTILETDERLDVSKNINSKQDFDKFIYQIPEVIIAKSRVTSYEALNKMSKSYWLPFINISGRTSQYGDNNTSNKNSWNANISASYFLFAGGKHYANIQTAENQFKIAIKDFRNTVNHIKSAAVANHNALIDAFETISVRETYLEAAKLQSEISTKKYVNGLSSYQDWYSIENDYITAQKNFLDTKKNAELTKYQWHNFIGDGF